MSIEASANNGTATMAMESNAMTQPMAMNVTQPISPLLPGVTMSNGIDNGNIKRDTIGHHNNGTANDTATTAAAAAAASAADALLDASNNDTECKMVLIPMSSIFYL